MPEDVFLTSPRKGPVPRRSATNLRGPTSLAGALDGGDDANANGRFSLAHELAVAMMPEPSAGSKLLAEEFGIEFDEGAEGIDDPTIPQINVQENGGDLSFAESDPHIDSSFDESGPSESEPPEFEFGGDPAFSSPPKQVARPPEQDAMEVLAQNLESTDNFLSHLRRIDADPSSSSALSSSSSAQPALERLASDVIRRINETARDRESQVRELLGYEREFRRIAGEVGGEDVLGRLDALPVPEDDDEPVETPHISAISEEEPPSASPTRPHHARAMSQDWEMDPDVGRLGDTDPAYDEEPPASPSPAHPAFSAAAASSAAPSSSNPPSSLKPAAHLASLRTLTTSLVASLTSVSEHAQVNGAATADAGRKLRALRNRLGGWRSEWEGAERSRGRIERWERGEGWEGTGTGENTPVGTPSKGVSSGAGLKRVDGRQVVQEHLSAFELALADAAVKTKAIMAAS